MAIDLEERRHRGIEWIRSFGFFFLIIVSESVYV
jgi:hypothetical protein